MCVCLCDMASGVQMMWAHWQEALKWRILYLAWKRRGDSAHTILVQDIPGTPHGTIIGRIYDVRPPSRCVSPAISPLHALHALSSPSRQPVSDSRPILTPAAPA